jgi:hypothetical protein
VIQVPGSLPRLYDQTESTTDISRIETIQPLGADTSGAKQAEPAERKGPQGTRVMPQTMVQEVVAYAEARKAAQGGAAPTGQAQAYKPSATPSQGMAAYAPSATPPQAYAPQGAPPHATPVPTRPSQMMGQAAPAHAAPAQAPPAGSRPISHSDLRVAPGVTPPPGSGVHPAASPVSPTSGIHPVSGPSGWGVSAPPSAAPTSPSQPMMRMPTPPPGSGSAPPPSPQAQSGMRMASQPPHGPMPLQTMRLPDEQTSIPGSQDRTTVYRPKKKAKSSAVPMYVIGAIAFAVVGFGIVYFVQMIVRGF